MTADPAALGGLVLAVERPEIDWPGYITWTIGMLVIVALLYWLMRRAWRERGRRQSDLPPLATAPAEPAGPPVLTAAARYYGSTTAGQWLDRIIAHGLGTRSRAELTLTDAGLDVVRPGAQDFFIPAAQLRGARLDKGIAGKVLTEGGLLVVTWEHGGLLLDSGFRADRAAAHPDWLREIDARSPESAAAGQPADQGGNGAAAPHPERDQEGAR